MDFLQAMKETKKEFQKAKEQLGSDGAVDLFLNLIRREEEEEQESESESESSSKDDEIIIQDDDDDDDDNKGFQ